MYRGHPYCEACHVRLRAPKCKRCARPVRDGQDALEALGGKWHWECFVCAVRSSSCSLSLRSRFSLWCFRLPGRRFSLFCLFPVSWATRSGPLLAARASPPHRAPLTAIRGGWEEAGERAARAPSRRMRSARTAMRHHQRNRQAWVPHHVLPPLRALIDAGPG